MDGVFQAVSKRWKKLIIDRFKAVSLFYSDTVNHLLTPHIYLMISLSGPSVSRPSKYYLDLGMTVSLCHTGPPKIEPWAISGRYWLTQAYLNSISGMINYSNYIIFFGPLMSFFPSHKTSFSSREEDHFVVTDCAGHRNPFLCLLFYDTVNSLRFFTLLLSVESAEWIWEKRWKMKKMVRKWDEWRPESNIFSNSYHLKIKIKMFETWESSLTVSGTT